MVNDNRGGGGQVIASQIAASAPPDGYTLFLASATHSINPALRNNLPYDTLKDFLPITLVAEFAAGVRGASLTEGRQYP